jgi:hypothetical protein
MSIRIRAFVRATAVLAVVLVSCPAFSTTKTWNGSVNDSWSNSSNWTPSSLPTSSDDVIIANAGSGTASVDTTSPTVKSITIQNGATLRVEGGQALTVTNSSTIDAGGTLNLVGANPTGGIWHGAGNLTVNGTAGIHGNCTIDGSGNLIINSGGNLDIGSTGSGSVITISRTVTNNAGGTITLQSNSAVGFLLDSAHLGNDGTIDLQSDHNIDPSGTGSFISNNSGSVIQKSAGSGTAAINVPVNNGSGASIQVSSGRLDLNNGGALHGAYSVASGNNTLHFSGAFTAAGSPSLTVNSGATFDAGSGVDVSWTNVTLSGGTITGAGIVRVSGNFNSTDGTISGSGQLFINSGGVLNIGASAVKTISRDITNQGTINFLNTSTAATNFNGNTITNTGTIDIQNGQGLLVSGGTPTINNNSPGVIRKTTNSAPMGIDLIVNNAAGATVETQIGHLYLNGGGTDSGIFSIFSGTQIRLGPNGNTFTMSGSATVTGANGTLAVVGATLDAGVNVTIPNLLLALGTITGAGTVQVSGNFTWSAGTISGSGTKVLTSTSTPTIDCSLGPCNLNGATLQLQATATLYSASSNALVMSNGASLILDPGKGLDVTNDGNFNDGGGAASSIVIGGPVMGFNALIRKWTTSGTSIINVPVTVSGSFLVETGTLRVTAGVTVVLATAILDYRPGATLEVAGGVFLINANGVSFPFSGDFKISGGTLRVPTGITASPKNVTLQTGGVIDGGGTLILSGTSTWSGGTMGSVTAAGGTTQINSGNTLSITAGGAQSLTQSRELINAGTINYAGTTVSPLTMSANGKITNNNAFNLTASSGNINLSAGALIENNGTITKTTGPGTTTISPPLDNKSGGTVSVSAGTIALAGGGTERGAFTVASGATLAFASGVFTMLGGPTIGGAGSVSISGATMDVGDGPGGGIDLLAITAPVTFSAGTVNVRDASLQNSSAFSVSGTIEHYGGHLSGNGTMTINSGGILNCRGTDSAAWIAINTTVNSGGRINFPSNAFGCGMFDAVTVTNDGTIDFQSDAGLSAFSGAPHIVNSTGTIKKSAGSGISVINIPTDSNGGSTLQADSGTLAFNQSGNFTSVTISGSSGIVALPATASVSGTTTLTGRLELTGNATLAGTLNAGGTLLLDNGVDVTWPNVSLTAAGSKIDGAGTLRVSGNFNWSGGTITGSGPRVMTGTSVPTISCSAGNCMLDGGTLRMQTFSTYSASSNALVFSNGATFILDPGQTIEVTNDGDFVDGGGAPSSIQIGGFAAGFNACIWKTTTSGTTVIGVPVTMSGSFLVQTGTLQVTAGVSVIANTAIVDYRPGATLELAGGVFLVNANGVSFPFSGDFKVSGGTLRVPTGITASPKNVTLQSSGVIDGGGTLILSGTSTWSGGTMGSATAPGGTTQVNSGNTLNVTGAAVSLAQGRNVLNNGTMNLTVDGNVNVSSGGTITNGGTLTKNGGSGTTTLFPTVNNTGTVAVTTGTLALAGGGSTASTYSISTTLALTGGTLTVANGSSVTGGGTLSIAGGTADVSSGANVTWSNVSLSSGTIGGAGTLHVSGNFTWAGGTISGSGPKVMDAASVPTISCSASNCALDGGTLQMQAWSTYSASSNALTFSNGGSLILDPGKVLFVSNNGNFVDGGGAASSITIGGFAAGFNGCIEKTTTAGTSTIGVPVTMFGSFKVVTGTLRVGAGVTVPAAGAIVHYDPGTTLELTGGVFLFNSSSVSFPANGDFKVSGGTLRVPTGIAIAPKNVTLQGGTIDGAGTLTLTGTSAWSNGTMGSATAPGGTTQIGSGNTLNITGGAVSLAQGRVLQNDGTLNLTVDGNVNVSSGGTITNNGTLTKNGGSGTTTLFPTVNSTGTVSATSGTLALTGGGSLGGNVVATSPAAIAFPSGTYSVAGAMSGTGTIALTGGAVTISSPFTIPTLSVTAGNATLDANGSANAFTMSGGTLGGSGTFTLTNGGTWSGGTMSGSGTTLNPTTKILGITAPVTLNTRTLQNDGTLSLGADISGSGTLANNGTLNAGANVTVGVLVNNGGQVATSNALSLSGGGTHSGGVFTATAPGSIAFSGGTHTLSGGGSIGGTGTVSFNGATATVGVPVNVATLSVTAGTAALDGTASASAFTMTGGTLGGGGTLTLPNGGTWSGGTMSGSGVTVNQAALGVTAPVTLGGRTLQNDGTLTLSANVAGNGTIANNGTLTTAADCSIGAIVNGAGAITTSNVLTLSGGGAYTGSLTATAPGTLAFGAGTHTVSGGGSIGGSGTLLFSGATATVGVPINVATLSVTGGTATLNAAAAADAFSMNGGTLGGSGTLTLTNGGNWSGGTMSGSGTTANPSSKTLSINGAVTLSGRTLQNAGTLSVNSAISGSGTIDNQGTVSAGAGATINAPMNNNGQVSTNAILSLGGSGTHNGTFTANGLGSTVDFSGGTQTVAGTLAGTGKFRFSGGHTTVTGTWSGNRIDVAGGNVALNSDGSLPSLALSAGTLTGSGNLTVSGPATWSGGTIDGSGALTFDSGVTVTMPGTSGPSTLSRALANKGTIRFTAAANGLLVDGVAIHNSGTFDIQSSQPITATPGTPPFANSGTLKRSAGATLMQFGVPLTNNGQVQIETGTMQFSDAYVQSSGTTTVLAGATLQTSTLALNSGILGGNGTVLGAVNNQASVAPGASPGTLTIDGNYVQGPSGSLGIQLGGTTAGTQYDQLVVTGSVTLAGTLNVSVVNGFTPTVGNTFQILTFGSRANSSTFTTMNGLTGTGTTLVPTFSSADLQLITNRIQADLAVSATSPASVARGNPFAYTVNVFNGGGSDANGVNVTAALPPNVTFVSASPAVCSGAPNLVCNFGRVNNQTTASVVISVTADGTGAAPLTVFAAASEFDPNTANNVASASTVVGTGPSADLRIAVSGPASTVAGAPAVYSIVVTNDGPDAADVTVSATASAGLTFSANSGACTGSFPCAIAALAAGQSATIGSAWNIASSASGSVQLGVSASSPLPDPNSSNNAASATTQIGTCPAVVINAPAEIVAGASAEAAATLIGGAVYHWTIDHGTIDSGDGTAEIIFTAGDAGSATLAVSVSGGGCTLGASFPITVKVRQTCAGTAAPAAPTDGTSTADAVVVFGWSAVDSASGYRLWLQQGDQPPQSLGTTLGTTLTRIIPPGAHHWYVETLFDGCASHESEHRALNVLAATDCNTHAAPQLGDPADGAPAASATVTFRWNAVPNAIQYELWLALTGGTPTLMRATTETSYTAAVPPGGLEWYVRALFSGCAATESAHRTFTYTPPTDCTTQRPLVIQPDAGERVTSPVSFQWVNVPGATSYELYLDDVLAATTTSPGASGITVPRGERRWFVRAHLAGGCPALESAESRFAVIAEPRGCDPLDAPAVRVPAQISSGVAGHVRWTQVPGATDYVVEISTDPKFSRAFTTSTTVAARQLPFNFTNDFPAPVARYVRVHAVDAKCIPPVQGAFSPVAEMSILPATGQQGAALLTEPTEIHYTLSIGAEFAGQSFTATPDVPWLTVTPARGIVPPEGQTLQAVANTAGLPPGASTGFVAITTAAAPGTSSALGSTKSTQLSVNNNGGSKKAAKNAPPPDALIIPAVVNVTNNSLADLQSDVYVSNTSTKDRAYEINFVPTGATGPSEGLQSSVDIKAGATIRINEFIKSWVGGHTASGTLEVRPPAEDATPVSSAPAAGLEERTTFVSSSTINQSLTGVAFGQYVPAVPYRKFAPQGSILSLQQISKSDKVHTDLGLVEGSLDSVTLQVRVYDGTGANRGEFQQELNGSENKQIDDVLQQHNIALDNGRIEVEVTGGTGKVTAYASVVDKKGSLFVPPVTIGAATNTHWIVPGVAELTSGSGNWHTDVRIFNDGDDAAELTLAFYSRNGGDPTTKPMTLTAREVRQLDGVLASFFGVTQDAGALHVTSAKAARLVITARTYNETVQGAFGQFIPAVTPEETVAAGSPRPLQIQQVEESDFVHANVGFAEVSGKEVTLTVTVIPPRSAEPRPMEVTLKPYQFLQIDSLPRSVGIDHMSNARISVSVKSGEGRATAYLSLVPVGTDAGGPTFVPAQ